MTPEELAKLDAALTAAEVEPPAPRDPTYVGSSSEPVQLNGAVVSAAAADDWCSLRLETRGGNIRFLWSSADGDMRETDWKPRDRSNTSLALFVGFLKGFVAKAFGRVPVINPTNIAPLDNPTSGEGG
jgi:hypothetical protein